MTRGSFLYEFGPFRLNAKEQVLLRDGRLVPLPAKALTTLMVLVRNKGHVLEKDVLLSEIWPDEDVEEGNLAQHIFMLRRALGDVGGEPGYIETIPRRGYRFVASVKELDDEDNEKAIDSLAILPFRNTGSDPDMEYLSDGITESVMNSLSTIPQLKVMARSTMFRYKGVEVDPVEAGRTLGVRAVMAGHVQRLGEHVVIGAELVDSKDGSQIWGEQYHTRFTDIFTVQEELASEISTKLRLRLTGEQKERLTRRFTENTKAFEFYLRGRYACNKRSNESLVKGVEHFQHAIAEDPDYSLAHAGVADCLMLLALFGAKRPRLVMPHAKAAALKAIELDPAHGEAHASLGQILFLYDWNLTEAERHYRRAMVLSPTYPTAHQWYGEYLVSLGLLDEGIAEIRKALALDPLSLIINTNLGLAYYMARRYDLALEQLKHVIELEPGFFRGHLHRGMIYKLKRLHSKAISELEIARSISENPWTLAALGHTHASFGEKAKAVAILERLLSSDQYVSPTIIAVVFAGFDDETSQTVQWLEKACRERDGLLVWLKVWPVFDSVRSDARFQDLMRRIGFDAFSATSA